jgi:Domain of unknown function (DUF4824)
MKWSRRHSLVAGLALIALTNAVALLGAAYNRSGEPDSTLHLSQRDLQPPYSWNKHENSGLALDLRWRVLQYDADRKASNYWNSSGQGTSPEWLDRAKMASLGFDVDVVDEQREDRRTFGRQLARDVLLVLEFDGPAYQRSLVKAAEVAERLEKGDAESRERAAKILDSERNANSRIFVVDAGLDLAALRAKYADRTKYAIVSGRVRAARFGNRIARAYSGYVDAVSIDAVNVPLEFRAAFEGATPYNEYAPAPAPLVRYEATVAFGKRLEPWITQAARGTP